LFIHLKVTTKIFDNLLNKNNQQNWKQLQQVCTNAFSCLNHCYPIPQTSPETSQTLINGTEQFARLLGATLNNEITKAVIMQENIGMHFSENTKMLAFLHCL